MSENKYSALKCNFMKKLIKRIIRYFRPLKLDDWEEPVRMSPLFPEKDEIPEHEPDQFIVCIGNKAYFNLK